MFRFYDLGTLQLHQCLVPSRECGMTLDTMHDAHSVLCFEHHGMDSRVRPLMDVAPHAIGTEHGFSGSVRQQSPCPPPLDIRH